MPVPPTLALFQGGPLDRCVAPVADAAEWHCPRHALPVRAELVRALADQPGDGCLAYRRHAASPGRVVYRFDARREPPVSASMTAANRPTITKLWFCGLVLMRIARPSG